MQLRNAVVAGMQNLGYGQGYKYAHSYEFNIADMEYMPTEMIGTSYYRPTKNGYEARVHEYMERVKDIKTKRRDNSNVT